MWLILFKVNTSINIIVYKKTLRSYKRVSQTLVSYTEAQNNSPVKIDVLGIDYKSTSQDNRIISKMPIYSASQSLITTLKTTLGTTAKPTTKETTTAENTKDYKMTDKTTTKQTTSKSISALQSTSKTIPSNVSEKVITDMVNVSKKVVTYSDTNVNKSYAVTSQSNNTDIKLENYTNSTLNNSLPLLNNTELTGDMILYENTTTSTTTENLGSSQIIKKTRTKLSICTSRSNHLKKNSNISLKKESSTL